MIKVVLGLLLISIAWYISLPESGHKKYEEWKKKFDEGKNKKKPE